VTGADGVPVIGVLALQGDVREHRAMLERAGARTVAVRRPGELDEVDGLVMPGGESTTMSKLARAFDMFDPLSTRLRDGLPAFGTCAGMILLADRIEGGVTGQETLGGLDVVVRRNAFGRQVDSFEADLDVDLDGGAGRGLENSGQRPFHALFIRAPWVEKVGADVRVVAKVATGDAMGRIVAVRQANLLATSFHPEITGDHRFHALFVDLVRQAGESRKR
jgi:5'-phosphate synthase pdxT subunit